MNTTKAGFLPYGRQLIEDDDVAAVAEALKGDWLTTGPAVAAFEDAFAAKVGARHAVACSSGTAALHLSALALGLGEGDVAVVPSLTFLATANANRYVGAEVAFADVDPATGLARPGDVAAALDRAGGGAKAIYVVHLNGQCAEMPAIAALARERGLALVEDASHALGGSRVEAGGAWAPVGACRESDLATFSCHAVKAIAMGEGGVVTTNRPELYERLRRFRNHGMVQDRDDFEVAAQALGPDGAANPWYYEMPEIGFNYRATDLQCALGLSQLGKLDRFIAHRRALADRYDRALAPLAPVVRPIPRAPGCRGAWHLYVVAVDFAGAGVDRGALMRRLAEDGIGTQVHYLPLHLQPYYRRRYGEASLPGAEAYYAAALSLPIHPAMGPEDVDRVAAALEDILGVAERAMIARP